MGIKKLHILIPMIVLVICGLIGVQLYWVSNTFRMQKQEITRKVNEAVERVCLTAEEDYTCFETQSSSFLNPGEGVYMLKNAWSDKGFLPADSNRTDTVAMDLFYIYEKDTFTKNYKSLKFSYPVRMDMKIKFYFLSFDSTQRYTSSNMRHDGLTKPAEEVARPHIKDMVDSQSLNKNLKNELLKLGINGSFGFGIRNELSKEIELISGNMSAHQLQKSPYSGQLFADKYNGHSYRLFLHLRHSSLDVGFLWWILTISGMLTLALILAFVYFVRIIRRQKKLSEMKSDFINNMTHEFKTPITNISLATETLSERSGIGLKRLLKIIEEENNRLKLNVERILQIAFWENTDQQIHAEPVNLHELIMAEVQKFSSNSHMSEISCNLNATRFVLEADPMHLRNVIANILENAIKYGHEKPKIEITTSDAKGGVIIGIKDNGIGMDRETQKHIFDKFYRAHTGDLHNVKGFGLGLSYVRTIVEKHGGSIAVSSEPTKGSVFKLFLPIKGNKIAN